MLGTIVNVAAVIAGSIIGMILKHRLPSKITTIVFQAIGLATIFFGVSMAFKSNNWVILILSLVSGAIIGQILNLDDLMNRVGEKLKTILKVSSDKFSDGLVTAFLLFCMGSMTVLGSLEEGMNNNADLLLAKSVMDGFSSIALAAAMGIGVLFSALPLLIYQGAITLFAGSLHEFLSTPLINEITATGGILLIGMGINILEIKKIPVLNLLPAFLTTVCVYFIFTVF